MGKNSTIQLSVYVKLSVTVALEQSVKNSNDRMSIDFCMIK